MKKPRKAGFIAFRVTLELKQQAERVARKQGKKVSAVARDCLVKYLLESAA